MGFEHRYPKVEMHTGTHPRLGSGVAVWEFDELPEMLGPDCWAVVAARLLMSHNFEPGLAAMLEFIGRSARADRAWVLRFNHDLTTMRNTNEWCASGITSHVEDLQDVPVTMLGDMLLPLKEGQALAINDIELLGRGMRAMQREFRLQGIRSTLTVPVMAEEGLIALIGLDCTRQQRDWTESEVHALTQIAALIGVSRIEGAALTRERIAPETDALARLYLRSGHSARGVDPEDICAVEADGSGTMIHLASGETVPDDRPLRWWHSVLPAHLFLRTHRSAIANLRQVDRFQKRHRGQDLELVLKGTGHRSPVARAQAPELRRRLGV
ncbi:LytTR family transcriptional regulator DNA-binding domain-containing protein [Pseudoblastomonas halimionae]|uniref:GAF domain-containing protein n=1 Tax=Alteriqipengyuania halimionae TaxID=1926630 RepID=A0A6I4U892_9SPHN|nr:GAF domain-containing DNA-binding protein [Alteriqipengyuania halimionae]MXP10571.1 GAF domain-containing protein [Alteriqipengyuania halimionae]